MTVLDALITDRTQEDVSAARELLQKLWAEMTQAEKTAYKNGLKGAYGPSDMNRVREALEYIDLLMRNAKRESVFDPVQIQHSEYSGTAWKYWSDVITLPSDYVGPDIYLPNINKMWEAARRFEAAALVKYDPDGNGYIPPGYDLDAGKLFSVSDSFGLLKLRVTAVCPPDVTAAGSAWSVSESNTGWTATLDYPTGPYPFIEAALEALKITCAKDGVVDGKFTLSAILRHDYEVTAGTCAVRWSPFITWGEARELYKTWGGTSGLTWDLTARGRLWPRTGQGWFTINYDADYGKE